MFARPYPHALTRPPSSTRPVHVPFSRSVSPLPDDAVSWLVAPLRRGVGPASPLPRPRCNGVAYGFTRFRTCRVRAYASERARDPPVFNRQLKSSAFSRWNSPFRTLRSDSLIFSPSRATRRSRNQEKSARNPALAGSLDAESRGRSSGALASVLSVRFRTENRSQSPTQTLKLQRFKTVSRQNFSSRMSSRMF